MHWLWTSLINSISMFACFKIQVQVQNKLSKSNLIPRALSLNSSFGTSFVWKTRVRQESFRPAGCFFIFVTFLVKCNDWLLWKKHAKYVRNFFFPNINICFSCCKSNGKATIFSGLCNDFEQVSFRFVLQLRYSKVYKWVLLTHDRKSTTTTGVHDRRPITMGFQCLHCSSPQMLNITLSKYSAWCFSIYSAWRFPINSAWCLYLCETNLRN